MTQSIYWYDYETSGTDPRRDRPLQFAGLRTDEHLEVIGEPLTLFCRPSDDQLPQPDACLITGITPQRALAEGLPEVAFIRRILEEFARAQTTVAGYNNLRFDDEVTRHTLYRNLLDPYAREWRNGNSRWDLIDLARMTRALRPEGIVWPDYDDGTPCFRLDRLAPANGIEHANAHDAMADVYATIAFAKRLRAAQPRLFDYLFKLRQKSELAQLINISQMTPLVHVSGMFPASRGHLSLVAPVALHPHFRNEVLMVDLAKDPEELLSLDAETLRERLFTPAAALPEGVQRPPVKGINLSRCPALAPLSVLTPADAERLGLDLAECRAHHARLLQSPEVAGKLQTLYLRREEHETPDPDLALYGGGFFSDADRERMESVHQTPPERLGELQLHFDDPRLDEMLFRLRARNWPESLDPMELPRWEAFRQQRLSNLDDGASIDCHHYFQRLAELRADTGLSAQQQVLLDELQGWGERLCHGRVE